MGKVAMEKGELKAEMRDLVVTLKIAYKSITANPSFLTKEEKLRVAEHALSIGAYGLDKLAERL